MRRCCRWHAATSRKEHRAQVAKKVESPDIRRRKQTTPSTKPWIETRFPNAPVHCVWCPANGAGGSPSAAPRAVVELLQHLVAHGHHSRARLVAALDDDHVGELLGEVDVRHFQAAARYPAEAAFAGPAKLALVHRRSRDQTTT